MSNDLLGIRIDIALKETNDSLRTNMLANAASFLMRLRTLRAYLGLAFLVVPLEGAFAQADSSSGQTEASGSGAQPESGSSAPPSSYSTTGTPQYQPAASGGYSTSPFGPHLAGTSQLGGAPLETASDLLSAGEGLLEWGMVHFYPHFLYQLSYGNGLQSSPGQQQNTLVNQFSPGVRAQLGPHWALDYTANMHYYSSPQLQDGVDHAVSLTGTASYQNWAFGLSVGYSHSSQPLVETAAQTTQDAFSTSLNADYQFNSKLSLSLGVSQSDRNASQTVQSAPSNQTAPLSNTTEWSTLDWLNYQIYPQLSAGLGAGFTYDSESVGPDMTSENYEGRVVWKPGIRLSVLLSAGLSDQQYRGSDVPDLLTPIFSLAVQYKVSEPTSLYLSASSGTSPSYYGGQSSQNTSVNGGIHQRLLGKLFLDVSGGYSTTSNHSATTAPTAPGISDYSSTSFNVALSSTLFKRMSASAFYSSSYSSSGSSIYNYNTTQVGLTLAYSF